MRSDRLTLIGNRGSLCGNADHSGECVRRGKKRGSLCGVVGCYIKRLPGPMDPCFIPPAGCVLWCEAEAAQAINLERAKAWGYPINQIITPFPDPLTDVNLDNDAHQVAITTAAFMPEVKLIVVDSLSESTNKKENETEIKRITEYLVKAGKGYKQAGITDPSPKQA